jgi:hypothetical protein
MAIMATVATTSTGERAASTSATSATTPTTTTTTTTTGPAACSTTSVTTTTSLSNDSAHHHDDYHAAHSAQPPRPQRPPRTGGPRLPLPRCPWAGAAGACRLPRLCAVSVPSGHAAALPACSAGGPPLLRLAFSPACTRRARREVPSCASAPAASASRAGPSLGHRRAASGMVRCLVGRASCGFGLLRRPLSCRCLPPVAPGLPALPFPLPLRPLSSPPTGVAPRLCAALLAVPPRFIVRPSGLSGLGFWPLRPPPAAPSGF